MTRPVAPNAGSTYTIAGCIPATACNPFWVGLATPLSSSGCVVFFKGASPVAGSELIPINASPGQQVLFGPFYFSAGVSTCSITGGSALVYVQL